MELGIAIGIGYTFRAQPFNVLFQQVQQVATELADQLLPSITTVEIKPDVLNGADLIAWRSDLQLSGRPGDASMPATLVVLNPGDKEMEPASNTPARAVPSCVSSTSMPPPAGPPPTQPADADADAAAAASAPPPPRAQRSGGGGSGGGGGGGGFLGRFARSAPTSAPPRTAEAELTTIATVAAASEPAADAGGDDAGAQAAMAAASAASAETAAVAASDYGGPGGARDAQGGATAEE